MPYHATVWTCENYTFHFHKINIYDDVALLRIILDVSSLSKKNKIEATETTQ